MRWYIFIANLRNNNSSPGWLSHRIGHCLNKNIFQQEAMPNEAMDIKYMMYSIGVYTWLLADWLKGNACQSAAGHTPNTTTIEAWGQPAVWNVSIEKNRLSFTVE